MKSQDNKIDPDSYLQIGKRVYLKDFKTYGHIQKIEDAHSIPGVIHQKKGAKTYFVKRENKDGVVQGFLKKHLQEAEQLTLEEIAENLKPQQEKKGSIHEGKEEYYYRLGNPAWGVGQLAGEIIQNYWVLQWDDDKNEFIIDGTIPFQLCNRYFRVLEDIELEPYLNLSFEGIKHGEFYRHKESREVYSVSEISLATGKFKEKRIVTYEPFEENTYNVSFCRVLEDFIEKFELYHE